MAKLTITQGLPGSGKTTWTRQQTAYRVNRDDFRAMLRPTWDYGDDEAETLCTIAQYAAVEALLRVGVDVIVDDTNLRPAVVETLGAIADRSRAEFVIRDFTRVPLEYCIERDAERPEGQRVGEEVIRRMHDRYLNPGTPFDPGTGPVPGYVAGRCGHRVAQSEWNAGLRNCERCGG